MTHNNVQSKLTSLGFRTIEDIAGRPSLNDLLSVRKRRGIYVLHFENGEYYVGQSVNVVRRYGQHRQKHIDIQKISFKPTLKRNLDQEEFATLGALEEAGAGEQLRNISLVSIPHGETNLDKIMSRPDQTKWLQDLTYTDLSGTRALSLQQRAKYARNYVRYQQMPYADQITEVVRTYVRKCIPVPVRSEWAFWASSCLPSYSSRHVTIYSRINVLWQEVFTTAVVDGTVNFSWHLAASPFDVAGDEFIERAMATYPTATLLDHQYRTGGSDQFCIEVSTVEEALQMLDDVNIVKAMRVFNMRLFQRGGCNNSRYHCFDLADDLLGIHLTQ